MGAFHQLGFSLGVVPVFRARTCRWCGRSDSQLGNAGRGWRRSLRSGLGRGPRAYSRARRAPELQRLVSGWPSFAAYATRVALAGLPNAAPLTVIKFHTGHRHTHLQRSDRPRARSERREACFCFSHTCAMVRRTRRSPFRLPFGSLQDATWAQLPCYRLPYVGSLSHGSRVRAREDRP